MRWRRGLGVVKLSDLSGKKYKYSEAAILVGRTLWRTFVSLLYRTIAISKVPSDRNHNLNLKLKLYLCVGKIRCMFEKMDR